MSRWIGPLCVAAALVWVGAWSGNLMTDEGSKQFLGLGEGGWRELINPPLIVFFATLVALRQLYGDRWSRVGEIGFYCAALGIVLVLAGNVLEWGVTGSPWIDYGWGVFILGSLLSSAGSVALAVALVQVTTGATRVLFGAGGLLLLVPAFVITVGLGWLAWGIALTIRERAPVAAEAS